MTFGGVSLKNVQPARMSAGHIMEIIRISLRSHLPRASVGIKSSAWRNVARVGDPPHVLLTKRRAMFEADHHRFGNESGYFESWVRNCSRANAAAAWTNT